MAEYNTLEESDPNKGVVPKKNPTVAKLSLPNSAERRRSSFGVYNRTVLCAVDPSEGSKDAFEWYLTNVWRSDDLIVLVYCPEAPNLPSFSFKRGLAPPIDEWKGALEDVNERTRRLEEEYEGICVMKKLRYKVRGESYKNPGEGICKIAEEEHCDLIVLGSRGLGAIQRALMGSVSEFVVRNAGVPCLVVPDVTSKRRN